MNDSDNAQGSETPDMITDDRGDATQFLPPEVLQHIFTFVEPKLRKSVVALVCKRWKRLEATVPQHPTSIYFYADEEHTGTSCYGPIWLANEGFETSRLQSVTIECSVDLPAAKEECSGCVHTLLTKLGAKPSPLTRLDIECFLSQPGFNLLDSLEQLRGLKKLEITFWRYDSSEIPRLAELSNLQQLQVLQLRNLEPNSDNEEDGSCEEDGSWEEDGSCEEDFIPAYEPFRHALQSLTALTNLAIHRADILCPLFQLIQSTEIFCTQLRCLQYEPVERFAEEGLADCLQSMPALSSLTITSVLVEYYQFLPLLHHLTKLVINGAVKDPIVASEEAKLTSLAIDWGHQRLDNIGNILPLPTLSHLESLRIDANSIHWRGLPAFWSQLTNLTHLYLPRCEFEPSRLATLPRLQSLTMKTCLGKDPLGTANLLTLLQSLPSIVNFYVYYFVHPARTWYHVADSDAVIDEFTAEILRVQELLPDVRIYGGLLSKA